MQEQSGYKDNRTQEERERAESAKSIGAIRSHNNRPCTCGSGQHWANCSAGSQYCG